MLSIRALKSAEGAAEYYFAAFNYYAGDATAIRWLGEGPKTLGLYGKEVKKEQVLKLLQGILPDGTILQNPKGEHRPGFDLTFSAPKSLSILVGLGIKEAKELIGYFDEAVAMTIKTVEKEYAEARVFENGKINFKKTENLTIVGFRHPSTRANEPGFHWHNLVMNMTFVDGKPQSLASDIHGNHGFFEQIMNDVHALGMDMRFNLANILKKNNIPIRSTGDGFFEIACVPQEVIEHFSSRRKDIEALMKENGWTGAKAAAAAALLTRPDKEELDLNILQPKWEKKAAEVSFNAQEFLDSRHEKQRNIFESLKEKIFAKFYKTKDLEKLYAEEAVGVAIERLSQRTSVFTKKQLTTASKKHCLVSETIVNQQAIDLAITAKCEKQQLYVGHCPYTNKEMLTTPWLLTLEAETIERIEKNKGAVAAITTKKELVDKGSELTASQKQAMIALLTNKDRFFAIQGFAGVAKTSMLKTACQIMVDKGFTVRGITVASTAAAEMEKKASIEADVFPIVHNELKSAGSLTKTLFIVDEASMLSSPQGHELAKLIEQKGARLVFVGDRAQLPSVNNGRIFGLTQDYGAPTTVMNEILRQKSGLAREAVEHATQGEIFDSLAKVNEVREIKNHMERVEFVAKSWLNLSEHVRKQTLIFTPSHANRSQITDLIREGLTTEGRLTGEELEHKVLKPVNLEAIQTRFSRYYSENQVIRFNQDFKRNKIASGDYLTVGKISAKHQRDNILPLIREDGRQTLFRLNDLPEYKTHTAAFNRYIEIYKEETLGLKAGDTILWSRNFKKDEIRNSERAILVKINDESMVFALENKQNLTLAKNHAALKHLDHGYVFTNYKVQGKDAKYAIGLLESYNKFAATLKNYYVQISRAVFNMILVTDDRNNLIRALELNDDEKKSSLEAISTAQLAKHQAHFKKDLKTVVEKKLSKEAEWQNLETQVEKYAQAKQSGSKTSASLAAYKILSSKEATKIANSRLGFSYHAYRSDALIFAAVKLVKDLDAEEKTHFNSVKNYASLNKECNELWRNAKTKLTNPQLEKQLKDKAFALSLERNLLANKISENLETCKPFLKHFSIGELNRFGVPQFRYDEEGDKAIKRLESLTKHAATHQLATKIKDFTVSTLAEEKNNLAFAICSQAKKVHPFVLNQAKTLGLYPSPLKVLEKFSEMDYKYRHEISSAE